MDIFHSLPEELLQSKSTKLAHGAWTLIQFSPNPSTREVFNIGVIFKERRKPIIFKTLKNAYNFETMYGSSGKDNFTFLIHILNEVLQANSHKRIDQLISPSPQISFTAPRSAQGISADYILYNLFQRMVPLAWNIDSTTRGERYRSINRSALKETIRQKIEERSPNAEKNLFINTPISIPDRDYQISIDLPIFSRQEVIASQQQITYADITSMAQKSDVHRQVDLFRSRNNLLTAKGHLRPKGNGKLYIFVKEKGLNSAENMDIKNEIDDTIWMLGKAGIEYGIYSNLEALANSVLEMAA